MTQPHKEILLTGAYGFIGSHIRANAPKNVSITTLGMNTANDIAVDLSKTSPELSFIPETVIHAAGSNSRTKCHEHNVIATRNLCLALEHNPPKNFIYISSAQVYGLRSGMRINELHPVNPITDYGKSKLHAEHIVKEWCRTRNVKLTIIRPVSVIGSGMRGNPGRLEHAISQGKKIIVPEGGLRSFIHVSDLVSMIFAMIGKEGIFNATDGIDHSPIRMAEALSIKYGQLKPRILPSALVKPALICSRLIPPIRRRLECFVLNLTFSGESIINASGVTPHNALELLKTESR